MTLILASTSARRKALLRSLGVAFQVKPSRLKEPPPGKQGPIAYARALALAKARRVANGLEKGWVLGADTVVVLGRKIFGKPRSRQAACRMLESLQGTTHRVITAVAWVDAATGRHRLTHAVSHVTMRRLSPREVSRYARKHGDKAGSYAVQDRRDPVVCRIRGSFTNVVGLPLERVRQLLASVSPSPPARRAAASRTR